MNTLPVNCAPLIFARTLKEDFRVRFLAIPEDFSEAEISGFLKPIQDGCLNHSDYLSERGSRVVASVGRYIVTGIGIHIAHLCHLVGEAPMYHLVDPPDNRAAYAFIGFVVHQDSTRPFTVPMKAFLDLYIKYVGARWLETKAKLDFNDATKVPYTTIPFPEATLDSNNTEIDSHHLLILSDNSAKREAFCETMLRLSLAGNQVSFCSDIHPHDAESVVKGGFTVVTTKDADYLTQSINAHLQRQTKGGNGSANTDNSSITNELKESRSSRGGDHKSNRYPSYAQIPTEKESGGKPDTCQRSYDEMLNDTSFKTKDRQISYEEMLSDPSKKNKSGDSSISRNAWERRLNDGTQEDKRRPAWIWVIIGGVMVLAKVMYDWVRRN